MLYQRLLRLYPRSYRSRFAVEQSRTYLDQCRDTYRRRGRIGIIRLTIVNVVDLFGSLGKIRSEIPGALPLGFYVIESVTIPVTLMLIDPVTGGPAFGISRWVTRAFLPVFVIAQSYSIFLLSCGIDERPAKRKEG